MLTTTTTKDTAQASSLSDMSQDGNMHAREEEGREDKGERSRPQAEEAPKHPGDDVAAQIKEACGIPTQASDNTEPSANSGDENSNIEVHTAEGANDDFALASNLTALFELCAKLFDESQLDTLADLILSRQNFLEENAEEEESRHGRLSIKALLQKSLECLRKDGNKVDDDEADEGVPAVVVAALIVLGTHDEGEDEDDSEDGDEMKQAKDKEWNIMTPTTGRDPLLDSSVSIVGSYLLSSVSTSTKGSVLAFFLYLLPVRWNQRQVGVDDIDVAEDEKKETDMEMEELALLEYIILGKDTSAEEGDALYRHPTILMIRDYCRRNQPLRQNGSNNLVVSIPSNNNNQEPSLVSQTGDAAAEHIASAARFIEQGLASSVPLISRGMDAAGELAKEYIPENDATTTATSKTSTERRDANVVVALTYTNAARRATGGIRETARAAAFGLCDASARGITYAAEKFEEKQWGEKLVPNQDSREAMAAAGKIGLATLGAVAVVTEAMYETTKAVAQKGVSVTADVVRHRYGDAAGQVVEDTGETTGNVLRTIAHVGMLETRGMANLVAKRTGKNHIERKWQDRDDKQKQQDEKWRESYEEVKPRTEHV